LVSIVCVINGSHPAFWGGFIVKKGLPDILLEYKAKIPLISSIK
jgi:hypothetical protein